VTATHRLTLYQSHSALRIVVCLNIEKRLRKGIVERCEMESQRNGSARARFKAEEQTFGNISVSQQCQAGGVIGIDGQDQGGVSGTCSADRNEQLAVKYDAQPIPVDVWIASKDYTIRTISTAVPGEQTEEIKLDMKYSEFNSARIELPPAD